MASDESIKKLVQAILDKRRELGLHDRGVIPPEEVIRRLNSQGTSVKPGSKPTQSLEKDAEAVQNKPVSILNRFKCYIIHFTHTLFGVFRGKPL